MAGEDEDVLEALAVGEGAAVRDGFFMLKESYEKLSQSDFLMTKKVTNLLIWVWMTHKHILIKKSNCKISVFYFLAILLYFFRG